MVTQDDGALARARREVSGAPNTKNQEVVPKVHQSLWLPIGRANFFSVSQDHDLIHKDCKRGALKCSATIKDHPPNLQVSTLRRLLEVLPAFYGYREVAVYESSSELAEDSRPVSVTLTLEPQHRYTGPGSHRRIQANSELVRAGVAELSLTVSETGFFTWTASISHSESADADAAYDGDPRVNLNDALRSHIGEIFGGKFSLRRYDRDRQLPGDKAMDLYRGRASSVAQAPWNGELQDSMWRSNPDAVPLGIMTFFQLNTLFEGLINETLMPAVFFEDYSFLMKWTKEEANTKGFRTLGEFIELLLVDDNAANLKGQISALDHFLAVTSREVLQKIKWSVESVRRGLLDEMMSVLHRQSSLNQLTLGEVERTPEQAVGANESQLRGYVMLAASKLPLITNVERYASAAALQIKIAVQEIAKQRGSYTRAGVTGTASEGCDGGLYSDFGGVPAQDLLLQYSSVEYQLSEWRSLLSALQENVRGLEKAIEHAWMERLLYEQEQVRAEQEAMAEIERSRNGRRPLISSETAINAGVLIFAVATVVLTARTVSNPKKTPSLWNLMLWPSILGLGALALAIGWAVITRYLKVWRSRTDVYDYEFAFRLDLEADETRIRKFLMDSKRRKIDDSGFRKFIVIRRGGARIERITPDSSLVKLHSSIIFRPDSEFWRRSRERFEIVTEILAHRVSRKNQYVLRETRIFGDTKTPLSPEKVVAFVAATLTATAGQMLSEKLDVERIINLATPIFYERTLAEDEEGSPISVDSTHSD